MPRSKAFYRQIRKKNASRPFSNILKKRIFREWVVLKELSRKSFKGCIALFWLWSPRFSGLWKMICNSILESRKRVKLPPSIIVHYSFPPKGPSSVHGGSYPPDFSVTLAHWCKIDISVQKFEFQIFQFVGDTILTLKILYFEVLIFRFFEFIDFLIFWFFDFLTFWLFDFLTFWLFDFLNSFESYVSLCLLGQLKNNKLCITIALLCPFW